MAAQTRSSTSATKGAGSTKRGSAVAKRRPKPSTRAVEKPEVRIFVSYSHVDAKAQAKLKTHLAPWERDGVKV